MNFFFLSFINVRYESCTNCVPFILVSIYISKACVGSSESKLKFKYFVAFVLFRFLLLLFHLVTFSTRDWSVNSSVIMSHRRCEWFCVFFSMLKRYDQLRWWDRWYQHFTIFFFCSLLFYSFQSWEENKAKKKKDIKK